MYCNKTPGLVHYILTTGHRRKETMAVDYGTEHLGRSIAASDIDVIRATIRRRFMARIAMASWRGYMPT